MPKLTKRKPARLMNEEEVLKKLGIPDFRHLSKNTAIEFIGSIPQMDPEVAKKALEQFPELANMALGLAKEYKEGLEKAFEENGKSSDASLAVINAIIEVLTEELKKEECTAEERLHIIDKLTDLAKLTTEVHKDNQNFILKGLAIFAGVVGTVAIGAIAVLGANGKVEIPELDESSETAE